MKLFAASLLTVVLTFFAAFFFSFFPLAGASLLALSWATESNAVFTNEDREVSLCTD
jgi:hypothetical protein